MRRWRLFVMPLIVLAVGLWVNTFNREPEPIRPTVPPKSTDESPLKIDTPQDEPVEKILQRDPVRFLEMSLEKYDKTIKGYALIFDKHERVQGKMRNPEKTEVRFREQPFSVFMRWKEGAGLASQVLYVEGENNDKMLARGRSLLALAGIQTREVDGPDAKAAGRFTIAQFGFKRSTERSLASMKKAQERGQLHVRYEGIVPVEKLGGQKCHKIVRTPYEPTEEDGLNELTLYYDTEHWLQVGAVLIDASGQLLGEYWFSDVQISPEFPEKQFTRDAL